jgi:glycosyltransferase involved in cell wall biosynthesis
MNCRENGTLVFPELPYESVNALYNASWCCVNTSSEWGGGQRTSIESLATNTPVIVMSDSPKNREYIEESGCGLVVPPSEDAIRKAIEEIKTWTEERRNKGREYILSKYSHHHYAKAILTGIDKVLKNE